jgi:protein gp37
MGDHSKIEWTDATWNPTAGCWPVSPGCLNCYAGREAARLATNPKLFGKYEGTAEWKDGRARWTNVVREWPSALEIPLRWKRPRQIFVDSMSDLFHEGFSNEYIAAVFGVMAATPWHTYQVLTKRAERLPEWFAWHAAEAERDGEAWIPIMRAACERLPTDLAERLQEEGIARDGTSATEPWPLPNVWLGVSVEDQQRADERLPHLLRTPAAVRWVSAEPLLGPVDFESDSGTIGDRGNRVLRQAFGYPRMLWACPTCDGTRYAETDPVARPCSACGGTGVGLRWVVVGGESGPRARPMHPDWARSLRDQCVTAGVPFLFKQWGAWAPDDRDKPPDITLTNMDGQQMAEVGKKAAGRELDGVTWDQYPAYRLHVRER